MEIVLRIPTKPQYSFAEVRITAADKADALTQLGQIDDELSEAIKDAVEQSTAVALLKTQLGGTVVPDVQPAPSGPKKPWQRTTAKAEPVDATATVKAAPPSAADFFS